jgi:tRNA-dihydrouridine synthase A
MHQPDRTLCIAPMMDWTDRHCRFFHRLIAPSAWLYTEMVTTGALIHGDRDRHLRFDDTEHPIALQLGGSEPDDLATCAKMAEDYGYDEINLNCGCPSERVQKGAFGACLMREPALVADCVAAMKNAVKIPVTLKCRIGIDDSEEYEFLEDFVLKNEAAGCDTFIIHARKAWLKGLSPKENREVPPLKYDVAHAIKQNNPHLTVIVNGGIKTLEQVQSFLPHAAIGSTLAVQAADDDSAFKFDGIMIGREAYQNPWFLRELEEGVFGTENLPDRAAIVRTMIPYAERQMRDHGTPVKSIARHMLGLFNGMRGAREWRRILSTEAVDLATPPAIFEKALAAIKA